ncbi:MAG: peptidoglycan editing factor PgeF [Candidatus Accumulibacter sp.]|jgi:YfiH family protein|uniref:peptidoglycan editing factor PgeF n=1 Tax=Accumulibacter sp. TaxID=2053492 RepID=UPI00207EDFE6|nr:peptidoglycan editing factor PgeF [Accumulibacter sp.]MBK8116183.1 peptidoglycan editing factor PgeF [Accumulibacter sp.]MBK8384358.1 peptidoglycan editing factor PgeF [Accumulibacter sp.]MBK8577341.1 peptidoglycan editing factor PgeF [Candidatus Accumulibacter propinquus]
MQPDALINEDWIIPDWPAPARVCSLITTRLGGVSVNPYASLNLGDHVGDDPLAVAANRRRLNCRLPAPPFWLNQVHGTAVVDAAISAASTQIPTADAAFTHQAGIVCGVMTADCLPVLLCDRSGTVVAAAHAGWRGLQAGILERTVAAMGLPGTRLLAYLGPAIGPQAFEVGAEVRSAFVEADAEAAGAFRRLPRRNETPAEDLIGQSGHGVGVPVGGWLADIYLLARQSLGRLGVESIYGGGYCTASEEARFFSYRRDGVTGRMASLIWLSAE